MSKHYIRASEIAQRVVANLLKDGAVEVLEFGSLRARELQALITVEVNFALKEIEDDALNRASATIETRGRYHQMRKNLAKKIRALSA